MLELVLSSLTLSSLTLSSLALGFTLGCVHAFDIDHVMAVSAISSGEKNVKQCIHYSGRWAVGHGAVLITLGVLFFAFGLTLPESVALVAEKLIGLLLILFGGFLIYQLIQHQGIQNLINMRSDQSITSKRTPFAVGIIHGLAGNAPVLAMLPALTQNSIFSAISYLVFFSMGLLASMILFGLSLAKLQRWLSQKNPRYLELSVSLLGVSSLAIGIVWIGV